MAPDPDLAEAVLGLIDSFGPAIIDILPSPINFIAGGILGFIKGLIQELLG